MKTSLTRKSTTLFLVALLSTLALVVFLIALALSSLRQEAIQTHRHIAALHASALEEHFSQILQQVDHTIDRLPFLSTTAPGEEKLTALLEQLLYNAPYLRSLSLLELDGRVIASSHLPNVSTILSLKVFYLSLLESHLCCALGRLGVEET